MSETKEPPMTENQWRPIESAPKDGTVIIIGKHNWDRYPAAKWDFVDVADGMAGMWVFEDDWVTIGVQEGVLGWNEDYEEGTMPTHWIHRPPPPMADSPEDKP